VSSAFLTQLLAANLIIAVAALVQGSVGFGLALLSAPFLALLEPRLVPGPLILVSVFLTVLMSARDRQSLDVRGVGLALVGRAPGSLLGALLLTWLARDDLTVLFGVLVVLGALMMGFGPPIRPTRVSLLLAGLVSGVMGTASSIGGPPMALLYQRESGPRMRSTLSAYFTIGAFMSTAALLAVGKLGWFEVRATLQLVPGILVGFVASSRATRWLDRGRTRSGVLWVAGLSGALLVVIRYL